MLELLASIASVCLCLVFPLSLTIKSLNNLDLKPDPSSSQLNQLKFLFHYWIYYIMLTAMQNTLFVRTLDMSFFNVADLVFLALKMWLFYGKGCLVMSYYYVNHSFTKMLRNNTSVSNLDVFEHKFVDPLANIVIFNSGLVNHFWSVLSSFTGSHNVFNSIVLNFQTFNSSLAENYNEGRLKAPFFLNYALSYFCTIDNQTVYKQYKYTGRLLSLFSIGGYQATSMSRKPSGKVGHQSSFPNLFVKKTRTSSGPAREPSPRSTRSPSPGPQNNTIVHSRHGSNNSHYRPNPKEFASSKTPDMQYLTPTGSPQIPTRTGSAKVPPIDKYDYDTVPRGASTVSPDPITDALTTAFATGVPSSGGRSRSGSNPTSQVNMPPNAISIDELLNRRYEEARVRSRASTLSDPPYPV